MFQVPVVFSCISSCVTVVVVLYLVYCYSMSGLAFGL